MILRLSSRVARGFLVLFALALAAEIPYSTVRNALAAHESGLNTLDGYERAAQLEPRDANNWYSLGRYWQYNLENPDIKQAILDYRKALSYDPLSADVWMDMASAYEAEGQIAEARHAFVQAEHDYPLSPEASWRYGNFLLRQGELSAAFAQVRHAVEVAPVRASAAFALFMRVDPGINAVLDGALPRSQDAYLNVVNSLAAQGKTDQALVVWSRLAALHPHLLVRDANDFINALIDKRRMSEASRVWDQTLAFAGVVRPPDPPGSLVWDGGFESDVVNAGFGWRYPSYVSGVQINLDFKEKHSGSRSLRLTFGGLANVDFSAVCQTLAVQPATTYRFSAWVRTQSLSTDQGVRFGLHPISASQNPVAWTDDLQGTNPWKQLILPWTSGNDVRGLLLCVQRLPSAQFDNKIFGSAWIDDVALVPETAENAGR